MQRSLNLILLIACLFLSLTSLKAQRPANTTVEDAAAVVESEVVSVENEVVSVVTEALETVTETEVVDIENEVVNVESEVVDVENEVQDTEVVAVEETEVAVEETEVVPEETEVAAAAAVVPPPNPSSALTQYAVQPYWFSEDPGLQVVTHHFCSLNEPTGVTQCALYDSRDPAVAKLVGVRYLVSEEVLNSFDENEKRFWHSNVFAVQNGDLTVPDLDGPERDELLSNLAAAYGKTVYLWDPYLPLPTGNPRLLNSFTGPNQIAPAVFQSLNDQTGTDFAQRTGENAGAVLPPVNPGADAWSRSGEGVRFDADDNDLPDNLWGLNI